ncbi:MAG: hypothetical protein LBO62_05235 [Endomicrobium sp.]|nr:hypothetical protein [Endomicrobium sp.]
MRKSFPFASKIAVEKEYPFKIGAFGKKRAARRTLKKQAAINTNLKNGFFKKPNLQATAAATATATAAADAAMRGRQIKKRRAAVLHIATPQNSRRIKMLFPISFNLLITVYAA